MRIYLGPAGKPIDFKGQFIECLPFLKDIGLNAVEVQFVRRVWMKPETARGFGERAKELGIKLSVHAPYFVNLCSDKKETVKASVQRIIESAELAEEMEATHVVFHPGFYGKLKKEQAYEQVKRALKEIVEHVSSAWIAPETMGNPTKFGELDELIQLSKEIEHVTPTLDFAHMHARGYSLKKPEDYLRVFERIKRELGKEHIKHLHAHFTCVQYDEKKGERKHLTLEARDPDFSVLAQALKKSELDEITIISESPILERDSIRMKEELKKLRLLE